MANNSGFELRGVKKLARALEEIARQVPQKAAQGLRVEAEKVRTEAIRKYVPRDLGTLANSIRVHDVEFSGGAIQVRITAGDAAAPYALAIHEHPSEHSPPTWEGKPIEDIHSVREKTPWSIGSGQRGPKYIERPLNEAIPGMDGRIAKHVDL